MPDELHDIKKEMTEMQKTMSKIEFIIEEVLVELRNRIKSLEKKDEATTAAMNTSCELKSREIDKKVKESKDEVSDFIKDSRRESRLLLGLLATSSFGTMLTMFLTLNAADNDLQVDYVAKNSLLHEKLNNYHTETIRNNTNITSVLNSLESINNKLDRVITHSHERNKK